MERWEKERITNGLGILEREREKKKVLKFD